jgi:protein-tyrosine phosphatase
LPSVTPTTWRGSDGNRRSGCSGIRSRICTLRRSFDFEHVLAGLVERVVAGQRLIVHCGAGIGRAGTTAVAVLVSLAVPLDEALEHVRRHRPAAGPEAGAQLELVRRLQERVAPRGSLASEDG